MGHDLNDMAFIQHIQGRMGSAYHSVSLDTWWSIEEQRAAFPLWSLSGQLKGFQFYNWQGDKSARNSSDAKYWTVAKNGNAIYGLQFLNYNLPYLFVCEGVFDCIKLLPYGNAVAVLSNDPKHLREQLSVLPFHIVSVCDSGNAGAKLAKYGDSVVTCPDGQDPGSMTHQELMLLLGEFVIDRDFNEEYYMGTFKN